MQPDTWRLVPGWHGRALSTPGQGICMTLNYLLRTSGHQIPGRTLVPSPTNVSHERTPPFTIPLRIPGSPHLLGLLDLQGRSWATENTPRLSLGAPQPKRKQWEGLRLSWHALTGLHLAFISFSQGALCQLRLQHPRVATALIHKKVQELGISSH